MYTNDLAKPDEENDDEREDRIVRLWHYTIGRHLPAIQGDGTIKLATLYLSPGERPAAWFSTNAIWEMTACKGDGFGRRRLTKDETGIRLGGLARIEVHPDAAPHTWSGFREISGVSLRMASHMVKDAYRVGASPWEWRVSFEPVSRDSWLAVEVEVDGKWMSLAKRTLSRKSVRQIVDAGNAAA